MTNQIETLNSCKIGREVPSLHSPVLDYGADFSPLLDWNGLEDGYGIPPERALSPCLCSGSSIVLWEPPAFCCLTPPLMVYSMSPHFKGGPRTTSGERETSFPPIELEFAPFMDPLRPLVAI